MRVHLFNLFNLLFILLGSGAVMLAGSIPFGFSWLAAFHLRKGRLLTLGFPWISILSSESRLINGLYGTNRTKIFRGAGGLRSAEREPAKEAI